MSRCYSNILITGEGSFLGDSFRKYASEHYPQLNIDTISLHGKKWLECDFSKYDSIFHVAGLAHSDTGKLTSYQKKSYYSVNTELAVETAGKALNDGVRQFIFMSSMLIYGDSLPMGRDGIIFKDTLPHPVGCYADSKFRAEQGLNRLIKEQNSEDGMKLAIIRSPMIYGAGCKGNYPKLSKLAMKCPVFPDIDNKRSMIYIENLCELICKIIIDQKDGVFTPQNSEYVKTSEMVRAIRKTEGKSLVLTTRKNR